MGEPLIYYISFLFDACVPIYCFCSDYAMYLKQSIHIKDNIKRIFKFVKRYWIVLVLTCIVGIILHNPSIPDNVLTFIDYFMRYAPSIHSLSTIL